MATRIFRKLTIFLIAPLLSIGARPGTARSSLYAGANAILGGNSGFFYVNADTPANLDIHVHMEYANPQLTIVDTSPGTYGNYWQGTWNYNCRDTGRYSATVNGEISVSASSEAGVAYGYASASGVCGPREEYWP